MINFWNEYNRLRKTKEHSLQLAKIKTCCKCGKQNSPVSDATFSKFYCMNCYRKQSNTVEQDRLVKNANKTLNLFDGV